MGIIENRGQSFEEWKANPKKSMKEKFVAGFASWGFTIPIILTYVVFFYMMAPTSISMFIALYAGIVISNCINFFSAKRTQQTQKKSTSP
jgi:TRAP-type C4-dicarboxylate transport system permease large subunit